jgi:MFS family permease
MIFPAKWFYIIMVIIFEAGSALCGGAPNMNALIVGRVIAGIGAVGIYVSLYFSSLLTADRSTFPHLCQHNRRRAVHHQSDLTDFRPQYIGMTGAMWGLGTVLGPVIGGAFTDSSATWRWAFYINLPIGALTAPVLIFLIPPFDALKGNSFLTRIRRIDWIGTTLLCGSITNLRGTVAKSSVALSALASR